MVAADDFRKRETPTRLDLNRRWSGDRAMNQMSDRIVAHHEEILDALDSLSAAVIADAEGSPGFG